MSRLQTRPAGLCVKWEKGEITYVGNTAADAIAIEDGGTGYTQYRTGGLIARKPNKVVLRGSALGMAGYSKVGPCDHRSIFASP
jgi:hypothetical protein